MLRVKKLPLYPVVFLNSFVLLCYEVILVRVLAIVQWQNFSSIIVSLAMLGFGISGSFLFLAEKRIRRQIKRYLHLCLFLFPISIMLALLLILKYPFNPFLAVIDASEFWKLGLSMAFLTIPFALNASVVGILFREISADKVYFVNLFGSGAGALSAIPLCFFLHPFDSFILLSLLAFINALLFSLRLHRKVQILSGLVGIILVGLFYTSLEILQLKKPNEFKAMSSAMLMKDAKLLAEKKSPLGIVSAIKADGYRSFPGMSLVSPKEVPKQRVLFFDGEGSSVINPFEGDWNRVSYLKHTLDALAFELLTDKNNSLIAGAGGGSGILRSLLYELPQTYALEVNPSVIELMQKEMHSYSGGIYTHPQVTILNLEFRNFIKRTHKKFDIVELSMTESFNAAASGLYALNESYLYTVESFEEILNTLEPTGILSVSKWIVDPPRDNIKLMAIAIRALKNTGIQNPENHLICVRSLQTFTLLLSPHPFSSNQIKTTRDFSNQMLFDLVWVPDVQESEVNRWIKLNRPHYYSAAKALLSHQNSTFIRDYPFAINVPTDDSPYFANFFKFKTLEHLRTVGMERFPYTEWGYLLLLFLLLCVLLISFSCILVPLFIRKNAGRPKFSIFIYFSLLGTAFFFVEIPLIQALSLYLGSPVYSFGAVISFLLCFSGIGSFYSKQLEIKFHSLTKIGGLLFILIFGYTLGLQELLWLFNPSGLFLRFAMVAIYLFPLGFAMGILFPLGIEKLKANCPDQIPWAWGINGFFSVISIILSALLAVLIGYKLVLMLGALCYLGAGLSASRFTLK